MELSRASTGPRAGTLILLIILLTACQRGNSSDWGLYQTSLLDADPEHLITVHGFADDETACNDISELMHAKWDRIYYCKEL